MGLRMQCNPAGDRSSKMVATFVSPSILITISDFENVNTLIIPRERTALVMCCLQTILKLKFLFVKKKQKIAFQTKFLKIAS